MDTSIWIGEAFLFRQKSVYIARIRYGVLHARGHELACAPHLFPVVFKGCAAGQANLVMASVVVNARPGELVRAGAPEELLEQIQWITA